MKKTLFCFLIFMCFSINSLWAEWSGQWGGFATEKSKGFSSNGTLSVSLKQTPNEYTLEEGVFSSRGTEKKWGPDVYTIQGYKLFSGKKEVGTISDEAIHVLYEVKSPTGTIFIEQSFIQVDETRIYYQEQYLANKMVMYSLSGTLNKSTQQ